MLKFTILVALMEFTLAAAAPPNDFIRWFEMEPAKHVKQESNTENLSLAKTEFDSAANEFEKFKDKFSKYYVTFEEELKRFQIFKENLDVIRKHNILYRSGDKSFYLGINQFSDMSFDDFSTNTGGLLHNSSLYKNCSSFTKKNTKVNHTVDWREKGYVTPVKNQLNCGSCWAFSTTGSIEGQHFRKTRRLISLSEQQLVDCSQNYDNQGCNGGWMDNAFHYIKDIGGIESESDYPYVGTDGKCKFNKTLVKATCTGCVDVTHGDEDALKEAVGTVGPVSIAIDASHQSFRMYDGGVYDEPECSSYKIDHAVLVVGYGTENGQDFWLVKNSWGTQWGKDGYIKMSRNKNNQCAVASFASFPLV